MGPCSLPESGRAKRLGVGDEADLTLADVFPPEAFTLYYDEVRPELLRTGAWSGEVPVKVAEGGAVPMYVSASARIGPGGETNGTVVYAHELPRAEVVATVGGSDVVSDTGLLPRSSFDEEVGSALATASRDGETCGLVLAVVDNGSVASEAFDALTAATVMRALEGRMTRLGRSMDAVGRVGENQLGLFLRAVRSRSEALRIARAVHDALVDAPITARAERSQSSSVAVSRSSKAGDRLADLIQRAEPTMWHAVAPRDEPITPTSPVTSGPTRRQRWKSSGRDESRRRTPVRRTRRRPRFRCRGRLSGPRALAPPPPGRLNASAFIDMIADTPLASQVDLYVTRETAAVIALTTRDTPLRVYVPVSNGLIADVRTEQYLSEIADAFSLGMSQMRLQVARSLHASWNPALHDALHSIRDAGVRSVLTGVEQPSDVQHVVEDGFHELHLSHHLTNAVATEPHVRLVVSEI